MDYPPILLTGPTTGGKTSLALELADRIGGELVSADMFHLISGFPLSTGLSDLLNAPHPRIHLYESIHPTEPLMEPIEYGCLATRTCAQIGARGSAPILEGCSLEYAQFLSRYSCGRGLEDLRVFSLTASPAFDLGSRLGKRIDTLIAQGLLEEVQKGIEAGYQDTPIMKTTIIREMSHYMHGRQSLAHAKRTIITQLCSYAERDRKGFLRMKGATQLEIDPARSRESTSTILKYAAQRERTPAVSADSPRGEIRSPIFSASQ